MEDTKPMQRNIRRIAQFLKTHQISEIRRGDSEITFIFEDDGHEEQYDLNGEWIGVSYFGCSTGD